MEYLQEKNTVSYTYCRAFTKELDEKGIKYRVGRWSKEETDQLKENWKRFFEDHEFAEPLLLLRKTHGNKNVRHEMSQFIQDTNFYKELGKGIQRPLYNVYIRARSVFHATAKGKFSEEELKLIPELQARYGKNKWAKIGAELGRSAMSVLDKCKWMQVEVKGRWTKEEEKNLAAAIRQVSGCSDLSEVSQLLPWCEVAHLVPGRCAMQCRTHWFFSMHPTVKNGATAAAFTNNHKISLIQLVCDQDVHDEIDIDWCSMKAAFPSVASVFELKLRWNRLKAKVPGYANKSLDDILDELALNIVPQLRAERSATAPSAELVLTDDDDSDS